MDKVIISNLEVFYHVGVTDEERAKPQRLLLTLEMSLVSRRRSSDNLGETVDTRGLTTAAQVQRSGS
jgi:dihydroneopterin aldolase